MVPNVPNFICCSFSLHQEFIFAEKWKCFKSNFSSMILQKNKICPYILPVNLESESQPHKGHLQTHSKTVPVLSSRDLSLIFFLSFTFPGALCRILIVSYLTSLPFLSYCNRITASNILWEKKNCEKLKKKFNLIFYNFLKSNIKYRKVSFPTCVKGKCPCLLH